MTGKKPIIRVRAFRGTELNYDANGKIKNENNTIAYEYGSKLWDLFLKNIKLNGYCKVNVESVKELIKDAEYKTIEDISKFEKEVQDAFVGTVVEKLTPDQKRIAELEAKLELLINANSTEKETVKDEEVSDINVLREKYSELYGKKPFAGWKQDKLIEMIEEKK